VRGASLTQQGQQLLWQVELDRPFSPETPVRLGGSLCLLIEFAAAWWRGSCVSWRRVGTGAGRGCFTSP
jgi:hypothetical protein